MSESKLPRMTIADILADPPGFKVAVEGCTVTSVELLTAKKSGKAFQKLIVDDGTGEIEALNFGDFVGERDFIHVGGSVKVDEYKGKKQFTIMLDHIASSAYSPETRPDVGTGNGINFKGRMANRKRILRAALSEIHDVCWQGKLEAVTDDKMLEVAAAWTTSEMIEAKNHDHSKPIVYVDEPETPPETEQPEQEQGDESTDLPF